MKGDKKERVENNDEINNDVQFVALELELYIFISAKQGNGEKICALF